MACGDIQGASFTFGSFVSEWLPLILNLWLLYEMLDAQEEAEDSLEKIANKSLEAAEELFEKYMELRGYDAEVYAFANSQPTYEACNRDKHAIQANRAATRFLNETLSGTSRFDCGARERAIRAASRAYVLGGMSEMEEADQFENSIEDIYVENQYLATVGASYVSANNHLAGGFGSAAALLTVQNEAYSNQAAGASASVGYFGGAALSRLFG